MSKDALLSAAAPQSAGPHCRRCCARFTRQDKIQERNVRREDRHGRRARRCFPRRTSSRRRAFECDHTTLWPGGEGPPAWSKTWRQGTGHGCP